MKPYWQGDGQTLYHGDAHDLILGVEADVILTDPPGPQGFAFWTKAQTIGVRSVHFAAEPRYLPEYLAEVRDYRGLSMWLREETTHDGYPFDLVLHFGAPFPPSPVFEARSRETAHRAERDRKAWTDILASLPRGVVLDPFAGTGTTLLAARDLGRRGIAFEQSGDFCEVIVERLTA